MASAVIYTACGRAVQELTAAEYVTWIEQEENGLHMTKKIGEYVFDLQYKPAEYVVLKENMILPASSEEMKSETANYSDMQYFTLRIKGENGQDPLTDVADLDTYTSRLVYFTGAMQHDLKLVAGADTLPCMLFHYEPTSGIDGRLTFLIGFPGTSPETDRTFLMEGHELNTGPICITIDKSSINNIPFIKFN